VSYLKWCFSIVYPRMTLHSLSLSDALGFIIGKWRVSFLEFLILLDRSQVTIHYLAYLMDLSSTKFFSIPSIDSYLVGKVTSDESPFCLSHECGWHKVCSDPNIIFVSCIFFHCFHFQVFRKLWSLRSSKNSSRNHPRSIIQESFLKA